MSGTDTLSHYLVPCDDMLHLSRPVTGLTRFRRRGADGLGLVIQVQFHLIERIIVGTAAGSDKTALRRRYHVDGIDAAVDGGKLIVFRTAIHDDRQLRGGIRQCLRHAAEIIREEFQRGGRDVPVLHVRAVFLPQ